MTGEQEAILGPLIDHLEAMGVPYFITGSLAGVYHGVDRGTHDADIAFDASRRDLPRLLADRFRATLHVDIPDGDLRQFNAIAAESDFKVDFWPIGGDPFSRSQLARRVRGHVFGRATWLASIEDLILAKLRWYARSDSDTQRRDIARLIALHRDDLDRVYLDRWASELGLTEHLHRLWNSSSSSPSSS